VCAVNTNRIINTLSPRAAVMYNDLLPANYALVPDRRMGKSSNAIESLNFWIASHAVRPSLALTATTSAAHHCD
jgi:hypothetical protein